MRNEESRDVAKQQGLFLVMMGVEPHYEERFNRWYEDEHLAERLSCPGFVGARRFVAVAGAPKYLTLYDLESPDALSTPEYRRWKEEPTEWTAEVQNNLTELRRNLYVELPRAPRA